MPGLLPADFRERGQAISESSFGQDFEKLKPFSSFDFWQDESIRLVDLPGHAAGHTGYLLTTDQGALFYVVDAYWDARSWKQEKRLPWLARRIQHSYSDYIRTEKGLIEVANREGFPLVACHCLEAQAHV